jgi:hypothetical protein
MNLKQNQKKKCVQNDQYDNFCGGGDDDDGDDDDDCSHAPQQDSQLRLPTENLSYYTAAPSSQTCLTGNDGTAPLSQQFQTSSKVPESQSGDQLVGTIPNTTERRFLRTMQISSHVGTQLKSNSLTSDTLMTSSELSGTSNQYDNSSSLLSSAVTLMVQQPTSDKVGQPLLYIPTSVYNSSICPEEGLHSGSLPSGVVLVNTVEPTNQTRVAGNVSTLSSSQQLLTFSNVSEAPSGSQFLGSIPKSKQRKTLESVESASNMGTQLESSSSTSNVVMTLSGLSDTSNQYANFSSSLNTVVPVMDRQPVSSTLKWPLQQAVIF